MSSNQLSDRLGRLFRLQDLDIMIREAKDPALKKSEEDMGFRHQALEKLQAAREKIAETIDRRDLRAYERIASKHVHGIVPVEDRTCLGCYMALHTSAVPLKTDPGQFPVCENCGRILYWFE